MAGYDSPWEDPNVRRALRDGRGPGDIQLGCCPECHGHSYYNEGSHFSCHWCGWSCSGRRLDALIDAGEVISLADYDESQTDPGVP